MQTENLQDTQVLYSNLIQNSISISSRLHLLRPTKTSSNETLFEKDNEIEDGQTKDKKKRKRKESLMGWFEIKQVYMSRTHSFFQVMSGHHHYQPFTFSSQRKTQDWIIWMQIDSPLKGTMALSDHQWWWEMGKRSGNEDQVSWLKPIKDLCPEHVREETLRDFWLCLAWH